MIWIVISLSILSLLVVYSLFWWHPKKLSESQKLYFHGMLKNAAAREPHSALIACDTILEHILRELGNSGTLGEMLQKKKHLRNIELFWKYHKIRNRAVHDLHPPKVSDADVEMFRRSIEEEFLN